MNKSYSKIRQIQDANKRLERRFLIEQAVASTPITPQAAPPIPVNINLLLGSIYNNILKKNKQGIVDDINKLQTKEDLVSLASIYQQTFGGSVHEGINAVLQKDANLMNLVKTKIASLPKAAQTIQDNPYYDLATGKSKAVGTPIATQEVNPYGYNSQTGQSTQIGTIRPEFTKATHWLPGDQKNKFFKSGNTWYAVQISDGKVINLNDRADVLSVLNKYAKELPTKSTTQPAQVK